MGGAKDGAESQPLGAFGVSAPKVCINSSALLDRQVWLSGPEVYVERRSIHSRRTPRGFLRANQSPFDACSELRIPVCL
jgi:hypothetical protein